MYREARAGERGRILVPHKFRTTEVDTEPPGPATSIEVSLVATPYGPADRSLGTVGVIGPTRMNYQRVIPLVQFTAQVLSSALKD